MVRSSPYIPDLGNRVANEDDCYEADDGISQSDSCHHIDNNSQARMAAPFCEDSQIKDKN